MVQPQKEAKLKEMTEALARQRELDLLERGSGDDSEEPREVWTPQLTPEVEQRFFYPLIMSLEDSKLILREQRRLNHHLTNVFAGTQFGKAIGELEIESPKKKKSAPVVATTVIVRKSTKKQWANSLLMQIIRLTGYREKQGSGDVDEQDNDEDVPRFVVHKPMQ